PEKQTEPKKPTNPEKPTELNKQESKSDVTV
ncbi:TPA: hemagglutinin, partial [Bacillus cereus]|nr:hemagglutinin [Bacillus cereus]